MPTATDEGPFGLGLSRAVCDRATRLARALFPGDNAQVVLLHDGQIWRSRDPLGLEQVEDVAAGVALSTGELIWVEDGRLDPRFMSHPLVTGPVGMRFYAGAPLRLGDGTTPGVLAVYGATPRPYDTALAARLTDLAEFVADEWARAQSVRAREQNRRERDAVLATLSAVVRSAPVSLLLTDDQLRVQDCSGRWAAQFGLTPDEAVGRSLAQMAPAMFQHWKGALHACLDGESVRFEQAGFDLPGGARRWYSAEFKPWRTATGEIGGVIAGSHDITEMVEALRRTERSEQRLTLALETADIHVYDIDYERGELFKAGLEERFFGEEKTFEELNRDIWTTIHPEDRPIAKAAWKRYLTKGEPYCPEYRINRPDGREVWVVSTCRLVTDDEGRPVRLIGALQNITARKAAERALVQAKDDAEAANRAKSTFLATMSHEIRTPLNGVLGMAQAMAADALSDVQRQRLDVIHQSGETLLAILNDVLDLSKIEAGKLELEEAQFDISELARGAHAVFAAIAQRKGISFGLTVDANANGIYLGDSTRVRQILYNLVSNALKFTERGEVRVSVERTQDMLRLSVADTGIGIARTQLQTLFQKFEQADASTTRRYGGTGLGLSICRELVQLMGGSIAVDSQQGRGTTFRVSLPLERVTGETRPVDAPAPIEGAPTDLQLRVLAAEDNAVNQLVLKTLLGQVGIEPLIVDNGLKAVEAWSREPWDVVLMDVQMPEMDGPTATAEIRAREAAEGRPRTPIVALTANAMAHQIAEYRAAGMDGFVAKPIEVARLFAVIQQVLDDNEAYSAGSEARTAEA
ncbi:ATP-binding protein [Phenylobacterium aquaticum]|uniref:ATP-binding protein n=1 Tax=Phenylobacterium aquaticum TaxID=1763816 RepID=UPI001F5CBACF|nr:ATP-binding protein [Phenylobacterium aquaticum]MCI3133796.1 ATP-binding protein [Phenylobacterium aquaticum]